MSETNAFSRFLISACLLLLIGFVHSNQITSSRKPSCQEFNLCEASGVCYISAQRYKCKCPIDRKGDMCEGAFTPCSLDPCKYKCEDKEDFQFRCLSDPEENFPYKDAAELLKPIDHPTNCDAYGLCLNGGRCISGYRHSRSLIYKCFCVYGYAGLNCRFKHAFGHDSQTIFESLKNSFEEKNKKVTYVDRPDRYYYNRNVREEVIETVPYEYTFIEGFGRAFILLNTEVTEDVTISLIEFHAAKAGKFLISFIQVPDCVPGEKSCASKLFDLHMDLKFSAYNEQNAYKLSTQLERILNGSDSYLLTAEQGFNSLNLTEPIAVEKGSILCITQIDGRLGGILPSSYRKSYLPDLIVTEKYLSNQLFTEDISDHIQGNESTSYFFSVLVSDTSLIDGTISDNSKLAFKTSNSVTTLASGLECVNALCLNGGVCVPLTLNDCYRCSCPENTLGKHCEILIQSSVISLEQEGLTTSETSTITTSKSETSSTGSDPENQDA